MQSDHGRTLMVMALALVSCRTVEPVEPVEPGPREVGSTTTAAIEPAPPVEPTRELEPDPPPQAVTPIELPFSPRALVVRPVVDESPVVLFPDEAAVVRRRVAEVLAARGHEVVAVEELERIEAAAAAGRLVLEGDQACRATLRPEEVVARYFAGRPFAWARAKCDERCHLQVMVEDPGDSAAFEGYVSRRVSRAHDPRAWSTAAGDLRRSDELSIGLGNISITSHPPPLRFDLPEGIGPWSRALDSTPFHALEGAATCAHPDPSVGFRYEVRASVDPRGRVQRCLATSEHPMAREADSRCVCTVLETLALPSGRSGRRFRVQAVDAGGFHGSGTELGLVQAGTEPWVQRIRRSSALAHCQASTSVPGGLAAVITLALDPDGAVSDVRIEGDLTTPPQVAMARCLAQELRLVPLPCRPPGIDRLQLKLEI